MTATMRSTRDTCREESGFKIFVSRRQPDKNDACTKPYACLASRHIQTAASGDEFLTGSILYM